MDLVFYALIPALALIFYICYRDRVQAEPPHLIILAFVAGIIVTYPVGYLNYFLEFGHTPALKALTPAVWEEGLKLLAIYLLLFRNKHFDEHLDGIVYAVCVGVGFEFYENLLYYSEGADIIGRMVTPGHFLFAIPMGYFIARAHFSTGKRKALFSVCTFIVPALLHWFWDFCCFASEDNPIWADATIVIMPLFIIALFILTNKLVEKQQKRDSIDRARVLAISQGLEFDEEAFAATLIRKKDKAEVGLSKSAAAALCICAAIQMSLSIIFNVLWEPDLEKLADFFVAAIEGTAFVLMTVRLKKTGKVKGFFEYVTYLFILLTILSVLVPDSEALSLIQTALFILWGCVINRKFDGAMKKYVYVYFSTILITFILFQFVDSGFVNLICLLQYPFLYKALTEKAVPLAVEPVADAVPAQVVVAQETGSEDPCEQE